MQTIIEQLAPQVKQQSHQLRMKIANRARYFANCPNTPYSVRWDGQDFHSDDTGELVDQVITWLKKPVEERAEIIMSR
jgi:hypothetical protein